MKIFILLSFYVRLLNFCIFYYNYYSEAFMSILSQIKTKLDVQKKGVERNITFETVKDERNRGRLMGVAGLYTLCITT